jgi:2-dehydropantoate 2-reductase
MTGGNAMKIAVLGIGGIGGVVGAGLSRKFDDINLIARGKALEAIKKNGLTLKSDRLGTFTVHPKTVTDNVNEIGVVDALIIATKSYGLEGACRQCLPIIGDETLVVPLLNGVAVSEDVKKYTGGKGQTADGCIYAFSNIIKPGVIAHIGELCHIDIGFKDGRKNAKGLMLAEMLTKSGIETVYSDDIMVPVWEKYIMMCGNSCIFAYNDCAAGEIHKSPEKMKFVKDVYTELYKLAVAEGVNVSANIVDKYINVFSRLPENAITSLYRDLKEPGKKTEFDAIIGKAARLAEKHKISAPCIKGTYEKYKGR